MARVAISENYYAAASGTDDYYGPDSSARFTPALYSKKTLRLFLAETVFQDITNRDYEGELKGYGSKLFIRKDVDVIVNEYSIGQDIVYDTPVSVALTLEINKAYYTAFRIDDIDKAQSDLDLVNMFSKNTKREVNIYVDQDVLEYMSTGADATNAGATAGAISGNIDLGAAGAPIAVDKDNAITNFLNLKQALGENNIPEENWFVVIPEWYANLLQQGDLKRADVTGDRMGVIRTGYLGEISGLKVYKNNNLYSVTDATTTRTAYYVLCGTSEATTFAAQIDKSDQLPIQKSFGVYWRTLFVWGRLVTQPTGIAVLYCEPSTGA
jgi:hypothetical protein